MTTTTTTTAIPTAPPFEVDPSNPTRLSTDGMLAAIESVDDLAWNIARKWHATNPRVRLIDIHEEVVHAFKVAVLNFDPSRGWKFTTYACPCAFNALTLFCRRENAHGMHVPESQPVYYAPAFKSIREAWHEPARQDGNLDSDLKADLGEGFWEWVTRDLTDRQRQAVLGIYRDGLRQSDVGHAVGLSKSAVGQNLDRAIVVLRQRADVMELAREAA